MKGNKPLPDLGKYLLNKAENENGFEFDQITITELSRIEPHLYTSSMPITFDKKKFMASFDIPEIQLVFILKSLLTLDKEFASDLIHFFNVPFEDVQEITFEKRPIKIMASTVLGDPQESSIQDESFIPLVITEIQAVA